MSWLDGALLRSMFVKLHGDVAAMSACACVCKPRELAVTRDAHAHVWRRLTVPPALAPKLTDERLAVLLGRFAGALQRIDLSGCVQLSADAIAAALTAARDTLTHVSVAHTAISGHQVVIALAGRRLTLLSVRGLKAFDEDVGVSAMRMTTVSTRSLSFCTMLRMKRCHSQRAGDERGAPSSTRVAKDRMPIDPAAVRRSGPRTEGRMLIGPPAAAPSAMPKIPASHYSKDDNERHTQQRSDCPARSCIASSVYRLCVGG